MALISFAVTVKLICAFVFAQAFCWFSYAVAHLRNKDLLLINDLSDRIETGFTCYTRYKTDESGQGICIAGRSEKIQVGNDQEMAQSERKGWEKTKMTLRYLYQENIVSRVSSYFPTGGHSVTRTELKI